jgi:NTP pyrophosphatase (non-canonical NTP hydrolase)
VNTIKRTEKTITPRQAILRAAVEKYGPGAQRLKAIEELSELIRALARADDPENIAEEMADVEIMLAQLRIILGNDADVERWKVKKLQRLNRRLHAAEVVE